MSIVALKRKTAAKYNNNSAGHAQFSIVGTHRSQGFIGQSTQSRFLTRTLMKGDTARGHGGCCGSYPNMNITSSEICTTEDSNVVKTSSKGNLGMLMSRYRWLRRPADESGASVKTVSSNRVSHSEYILRQRQRAIKDALNSAEDCTVENYVCTDRSIPGLDQSKKCKTTVKKPSHSKSYSEYLAERTRGCDIYDKPIINECMAEPITGPASALCTPGTLDTIAEYLRNYMTEFRNSNFWAYSMDGDEDGHYIEDGGRDMYDGANFTTPWLLSGDLYNTGNSSLEDDYPYCVPYSTITETVVDTDFHYVSLGWVYGTDDPQEDQSRHPLTILGYRCSGPVGWQVGGNIGADGDGYALSGYVYNNVAINGFTVYAGQRQVYDGGDPTICHLIILLGHPSWGSVFDTVYLNADDDDTDSDGFYMYAGEASENILAIKTLLSIPEADRENPIPTSELETIVQNFTLRIKQAMNL